MLSVSYAKQLIEETIRRNASPNRLDGTGSGDIGAAISCSSLNSSNSDEVQPLVTIRNTVQQQKVRQTGTILHSLSTNDASLGEYKYTVNVGQHSIKITGDNIELVRVRRKHFQINIFYNDFYGSHIVCLFSGF